MTERKVKTAADKAHNLDEASQILRNSAKRKWNIAWVLACTAFFIILALGVIGIFYQNHYALQNKKHIDCIIKDLATPPPPGTPATARKYIDNLQTDCNIKFTTK